MKKAAFWSLALVVLSWCSCYKQKDFDQVNIDPATVILDMKFNKDSLLANGADTTTVSVELPLAAKDSSVTLSATAGSFLESTKNVIVLKSVVQRVSGVQKRIATATFQTGLSASAVTFNAKVNDYARTKAMTILTNYASSLKIVPSALSLKADPASELTFTVNLNGGRGTVTPGQHVDLFVRDAANHDLGSFRLKKETSDGSGTCNYTYTMMPDTAYRGSLNVTAQATANGKNLKDALTIYIVKP